MTTGLSTGLVSGWLNTLRSTGNGGTAYNAVAGTFVQLHTGDPGAAGTANVSAGSTTRNSFVFSGSTAGSALSMATPPTSWTNGGTSESISHISVWTASTAGSLEFTAALTTPKTWASGDAFNLTTLTMSQGPQAQ
ncbi:phage tail fiber protein [Streptomyces sp. SGAir0957]